jgi:hypothetical protein
MYATRFGLVAGPGLRQAYRDFLIKPGELRVQGRPTPALDFATLPMLRPEEIVARLNLMMSVNGKAVTDLSVATARPPELPAAQSPRAPQSHASASQSAAAAPQSRAAAPEVRATAPVATITPRPPDAASVGRPLPEAPPAVATPAVPPASTTSQFRAVPAADLAQHVGKLVRIHLSQGATHEGRLLPTLDGNARLERRLQGGAITITIPLGTIESVEVLL